MRKRSSGKTDYWQSYSDMMAALLLIFMLILVVSIVQLNNAKKVMDSEHEEYLVLKEERDKLKQELDEVLGIKEEIITSLKEAFAEKNIDVDVDKATGAICLSSKVAFDWDSVELYPEGEQIMENAIPVYIEVLMSDEYWDDVSQICIEGFCDSSGSYEVNVRKSQERAEAVALYMANVLKQNGMTDERMDELQQKICITGRAATNLICMEGHVNCTEGHDEDTAASRRVEIKFALDDSETAAKIEEILEE